MHLSRSLSPEQILNDPLLNKGTAFTQKERDMWGLNGFLPHHVSTMEEQLERRYQNFRERPTDLAKYSYLANLQNRNEILFYRLVHEHIQEMVPLIYTPTVGDVSLLYSILYRKNRGLYISYPLKNKMEEMIGHFARDKKIDVIVVTDGERILGLGDVGIGGMAISLGKLVLYTLFGGIHPARVLPIMLDVGTNNPTLLNDPLYLGLSQKRIVGKEYDDFVDAFIQAIKRRYPKVLIQWEDFAKPHALPLLNRYREEICSFNDDIQGTAAVVLAAILSALKVGKKALKNQKIAILGGGSAGLGISHLVVQAMMREGLSKGEAYKRFYIVDIDGLVHSKQPSLDPELKHLARDATELSTWKGSGEKWTLFDVVKNAEPTILIGVCAQANMFTEAIVKAMAAYCENPIILPLSNPTSRSEACPEDLLMWTQGKAIIATGSPFPPVTYAGKVRSIAQCNNVYIFPGIGLGVVASECPKIIDEMFIRAAIVLSEHSPMLKSPQAGLFPDLTELRTLSRSIAIGVISNILGIGGGTMLVPLLSFFRITPKVAIGTSSACSLLVTSVGAISYLILGWQQTQLPETIGFIELPAFFVVGFISYFTAPYGVKLVHELDPKKVRRIFAVVLFATAIMMIV